MSCRHHWEDVVTGFFLGLTMAYIFYRQANLPACVQCWERGLACSPVCACCRQYYPPLTARTAAAGNQPITMPARNGTYSMLQEDGAAQQQQAELSPLGPQRHGETSEQLPV